MTDDNDINNLVARLVGESKKGEEEIRQMMEKRKEATHGLLSDYGALYAVAKELGVDLSDEEISYSQVKDIVPQRSFNIIGRVSEAYLPKRFPKKDGTEGRVASLIIKDETGDIRLTLWDTNAEFARECKRGDVIMVKNGYGKTGLKGVEIHAGSLTTININPKTDSVRDIIKNLPEIKENLTKISDITPDAQSVDVIVRISRYFPLTEFERQDGSRGARASFLAEDDSGSMRVVLWDENAKCNLENSDFVKLQNAYIRENMNGEQELHVGNRSRVIKQDMKDADLNLEPIAYAGDVEISEIKPDMSGFNTAGRVSRLFGLKEFPGGRMGSLMMADTGDDIRVVFWNEKSDIVNELKTGDIIKIKSAYAKAGLGGDTEMHVGKFSEVIINPDINMPELSDLMKAQITDKKISDIGEADNLKNIRISGKIADFDTSKRLYFEVCPNCGKKVTSFEGYVCEKCGDVEPKYKMIASTIIEDGTGSIRAVAFGDIAEKIIDADSEEIMNMIGESGGDEHTVSERIREKIIDREISLIGRTKYNDFSGQVEFIADMVE